MSNINKDLFEKMPVRKAVGNLMLPTIAGSLVMVIYSLADTLFVGFLNSDIQSAAVSLAAPALLAFNAVNNLFGVGSSSMMSRSLGAGDDLTVKKSASFGFYCSLISGVLLSALCFLFFDPLLTILGADSATISATKAYMTWAVLLGAVPSILNVVLGYMVRSEGSAFHASIGTMSGCILNIILDPFFILPFGLNLGAAGAGLATFISNCFACAYFFVFLFVKRKNTNIDLNPKFFRPEKAVVLGILGVGVPASVQNLLNVTGMTVLNNFIKGYGPAAVAAVGIAHKINMVPLQIALGGTQGVMPLIGYSYAAKNGKRMKDSITFVAKLMLPITVVITVLCWVFAKPLVSIFIGNNDVISYGELFLRGFSIALPFMLVDFLAVGVFQSVGMGKKSLIFALLRKIVFEIPAIFVLNRFFHAEGITYAASIAEFILAICGTILIKKIINGVSSENLPT